MRKITKLGRKHLDHPHVVRPSEPKCPDIGLDLLPYIGMFLSLGISLIEEYIDNLPPRVSPRLDW